MAKFSDIVAQLRSALQSEMPQVRLLLKRNPAMAYTRITEIGSGVGRKYGVQLLVNFPQEGKITDYDMYGRRDLSVIVDKTKKRFPIERDTIKSKAASLFPDARIQDAYMYEGKEGVKVFFEGGRIDILPHSLHIWCLIDGAVSDFCDWLFENVY